MVADAGGYRGAAALPTFGPDQSRNWTRPLLPRKGRLSPVKHVIALDVGGTGMKAALVAQDGALLHVERRPTGRERGTDAVVAGILDFAADLRDEGLRRYGSAACAAG